MKNNIRRVLEYLLSLDIIIWFYLRLCRRKPIIILYHGVVGGNTREIPFWFISKEIFEKQIAYLAKHYVNISLPMLIAANNTNTQQPRNGITITFDDGYENNYTYAIPLLIKYGFTASFFISSKYPEMAQNKEKIILWQDIVNCVMNERNYIDFVSIFNNRGIKLSPFENIKHLKNQMSKALQNAPIQLCEKITEDMKDRFAKEIEEKNFSTMMNWQQLKEIKKMGMEIGAHTMSHVSASKIPSARFHEEFVLSKNILEDKIGDKIEIFAFPYGEGMYYSADAVESVKKAGYVCALLALARNDKEEKDPFCLNRTAITKDDSFQTFKLKAAGIYEDINIVYRRIKLLLK